MIFLHRFLVMYLYTIYILSHASIFSMHKFVDECDQQNIGNVTKVPFKKTIIMQPFDKNLYPTRVSGLFYPEQCYTKRATLWCGTEEVLSKKAQKQSRCVTVIPFKNDYKINISSFVATLEPHATEEGVPRYYLRDDNYDIEYGYSFLLIGNEIYNESVPEQYRQYLPDQYFTKKFTVWTNKRPPQSNFKLDRA